LIKPADKNPLFNMSDLEAKAAVELVSRDNMAIKMFRPQPHQDPVFAMPRPKLNLVLGGNRAGKSLTTFALTTAIALDEQVTLSDGTKVDARMPHQKGRCLRIMLVGFDESHIGTVFARMLMSKGAFKIVRDPVTKELRAYNPEKDKGLKAIDSPPFLPARYIRSIAWSVRAEKIFSKIVVKDPATDKDLAEIFAYSSRGEPPQGTPFDWIHVDESLYRDGYIDELKARLVDNQAQLVWSTWPDGRSTDLASFTETVDRAIETGDTELARKVVLTMSGNKHLDPKSVREFLAGCATEEERDARDKGLFVTERLRMYPLFDKASHSAIVDGPAEDELSRVLRRRDGIPPNEWTKYLILDPGTNSPGVLLCAVPPPELGKYYIAYQQFYPGRMDAKQIAKLIKRDAGHERFYKFIIDKRASRQTPMGFSSRVVDAYEEAFLEERLFCAATRHRFTPGCDDVGGRQMRLNGLLHPLTSSGLPQLRIVTHRCKDLCDQLIKVKKAVVSKEIKDERKAIGSVTDLTDCLEYFVGSHPRYFYVKPLPEEAPAAFRRYQAKFGTRTQDNSISIGTFYS
jgi:hypothetical protein